MNIKSNCRFCGQERKLVEAHIIPEGFFRRLRDNQDPPRLLTNKEGEYPKKAPIGVYDPSILCGECEPSFGDWDNYAQQFLGEEPGGGQPIYDGNQLVAYKVLEYDYVNLKLFFISLLWRASVSSHPFYKKVKLGPYEEESKQLIEQRNPGIENDFSVTLAKFDHPLGSSILDPHPDRWDNVNYYRFYLGGYVAYIKVDKRKAPKPFVDFMLTPVPPLYIICRNLEKSKEWPLMHEIVKAANKRLQLPRKPCG